MNEDVVKRLLFRCISGSSAEREIACEAADEIRRLREQCRGMADSAMALLLAEGEIARLPAVAGDGIQTEHKLRAEMGQSGLDRAYAPG
jgi:hypothetical protein